MITKIIHYSSFYKIKTKEKLEKNKKKKQKFVIMKIFFPIKCLHFLGLLWWYALLLLLDDGCCCCFMLIWKWKVINFAFMPTIASHLKTTRIRTMHAAVLLPIQLSIHPSIHLFHKLLGNPRRKTKKTKLISLYQKS